MSAKGVRHATGSCLHLIAGDVAPERELAAQLLDQYGLEYSNWLHIETIDWRKLPQFATCSFQDNIPDTDGMDIVLCILWSRLGKPPPGEVPAGRREPVCLWHRV
ncbi:MAG: hypothetical protein HC888_11085 [Candidatus Competibacteraceae bacterium]|nr:hypothetical protein [Candidatus Competibacteraceae bacterium]